jgi:hypothetical protein
MKIKKKWRGAFNYRKSSIVLYAFAYTEKQAWAIFCRRLAKKDGVLPSIVMGLFDGSRDNHEITSE